MQPEASPATIRRGIVKQAGFVRISNEFALDGLVALRAWGWTFGTGLFQIHPSWGQLWFSEYGEGKIGPKGRLP